MEAQNNLILNLSNLIGSIFEYYDILYIPYIITKNLFIIIETKPLTKII